MKVFIFMSHFTCDKILHLIINLSTSILKVEELPIYILKMNVSFLLVKKSPHCLECVRSEYFWNFHQMLCPLINLRKVICAISLNVFASLCWEKHLFSSMMIFFRFPGNSKITFRTTLHFYKHWVIVYVNIIIVVPPNVKKS